MTFYVDNPDFLDLGAMRESEEQEDLVPAALDLLSDSSLEYNPELAPTPMSQIDMGPFLPSVSPCPALSDRPCREPGVHVQPGGGELGGLGRGPGDGR